jgi:hypothetical protein
MRDSRMTNLLMNHFLIVLALFACCVASAKNQNGSDFINILDAAQQIDLYIEEGLKTEGLERNEPVSNEFFVRRVYLDVVGRIPTYDELTEFMKSKSEDRRSELIDSLLSSEGYVSHHYNYWADVLRVKSRGRRTIMASYQDWIKESLRENQPYDEFVREMITSEGYVWDDPAVGYYLRDAGMPLDNMSNTAQVFLGTRMQCAQCHDHPFDKWTQKEYYHMAAYTFGLQAQLPYGKIPLSKDFQAIQRGLTQKKIKEGMDPKEARKLTQPPPSQRRVLRDLVTPMTAQAAEVKRDLKLPDDYQYKNARPKQKMSPKTPFGEEAKVGKKDDPREVYANWLTSTENPRFSKVIANRLWKKTMGIGLIEPVDNFTDNTVASNPKLMEFLKELIVAYDFDQKQYLRTLLNTRTYQSAVSVESPEPDETYHFQGPILRRMTAEQLWDSMLTLAVVDLDERVGVEPGMLKARQGEASMAKQVERVENLDTAQAYGMVVRLTDLESRFIDYEKDYRQLLQKATTEKERKELRKQYQKARSQKSKAMELFLAKMNGEDTSAMEQGMNDLSSKGMANSMSMGAGYGDVSGSLSEKAKEMKRDPRWRGMSAGMVRASEIVSPAPAGHFLRQFGQSDREIIENSNDDASITQALRLLNGETLYWLTRQNSALNIAVQKANNPRRRMDTVFQSFFSRLPTSREQELMGAQLQQKTKGDKARGYRQLLASLVNTQEFRFIQ